MSGLSRILVVDDDPAIRHTMVRALQSYDVQAVGSVSAALATMEHELFDLVLCDVGMPILGGPDLLAYVEERWPERARSIVFISGGGSDDRAWRFLASMQDRLLEKPFTLVQLREFVTHRLNG